MNKIRLGSSEINGVGVFSLLEIPRGELISELRLTPIKKAGKRALIWNGKPYSIGPFGCLNHSNDPNCMIVRDVPKLYAIKDIIPDEELTIDYGMEM